MSEAINHNHNRPNKAIKTTLGAWTILSSLSSLVSDHKTSVMTIGDGERLSVRKRRKRERTVTSAGPGQGSVGHSDEVGGPSPGGCSSA